MNVSKSTLQRLCYVLGGCKHGVAFLLWLHRRSEEPSVTSTVCYWKSSSLARVGKGDLSISALLKKEVPKLEPKDSSFLQEVIDNFCETDGTLFNFFKKPQHENTSIYQILLSYIEANPNNHSPEDFLVYAMSAITDTACEEAEFKTRSQAESHEWFEMRFGRITASVVYEAARCKTISGALTERILGASQPLETEAILRGKRLEPLVLKEVAKQKKLSIRQAGIYLKKERPIFGASPDGITSDYVIEIKCPAKDRSVERYISKGQIMKKFWCQIQMQMLFANKNKGLFCVASPSFEENQEVQIFEVELDKEEIIEVMNMAEIFWKKAIYPVLSKK